MKWVKRSMDLAIATAMTDILTREQFIAKMETLTEQELLMVASSNQCFICGYAIMEHNFGRAYDHVIRALESRENALFELFSFGTSTHYTKQ